jgi:beta-fructofuranosidase
VHLPIALAPRAGTPNADGCWSGSAVGTDDGPVFFYTAVFPETVCVAKPDKGFRRLVDDPDNPVFAPPPKGIPIEGFRDPCVWREDGVWYMTIGSGIKGVGGAVLLYRSSDLKKWEYVHPLLVGDSKQTNPFATGMMWECPQLVRMGNWDFLFLSVIVDPKTQYSIYFRGKMKELRFNPESVHRVDEGGGTLYAPLTFEDDQKRRILFGWIREERDEADFKSAGWAGVLSLPRVLSVSENGELCIEPAPETIRLRKYFLTSFSGQLKSELTMLSGSHDLKNIEMTASIDLTEGSTINFLLAELPQSAEKTQISYDSKEGILVVDTKNASLAPSTKGSRNECKLVLNNGEPLIVDFFLDGSVLEVYANRKIVITSRLYPTRMANLRLFGSSTGGQVKIITLKIHQLGSCFSRK